MGRLSKERVIMNKRLLEIMLNTDTKKKLTTFLNPYSYLLARKETNIFSRCNIEIDGIALVVLMNIFKLGRYKRKSFDMTSLAPEVFSNAIENAQSVYLIGTSEELIFQAVRNIQTAFPGLNIIGYRNGYFKNEEERKSVLNEVKSSKPDIVICGMGTPLQENFLIALEDLGWNGNGYTCGGFLHQMASKVRYYPKWIDEFNLRWLYRMYDEPKLIYRYTIEYPKFLMIFIYDYIVYKLTR